MVKKILNKLAEHPVLLGLAGSIMIALGSLGVGWIGPGSSLQNWIFFRTVRDSDLLVHLCTGMVISGGMILVIAWLLLGRLIKQRAENSVRLVVQTALLWATPLFFSVPLYSRDMFAYIGQGRLMLTGFNPYLDSISALEGWFNIGVDPLWANVKTPYGPLFLWLEEIVVAAAGSSPLVALALFRGISVAGVVVFCYFSYKIARLRGVNSTLVLWFIAANPVILFNFVVSGHNDSLMLACIVSALYFLLQKQPLVATVLITAAIAIKPIAILALPLVGLIWAEPYKSRVKTALSWLLSAAVCFGILAALGFALNLGFGWISTLSTPGSISHWYAPVSVLAIGIGGAFNTVGLNGELAQEIVKLSALTVTALAISWLMLTKRTIDPLNKLALAFGITVLLFPVIHPWYAAWVIILVAIRGIRTGRQTHLLITASLFFSFISIAEGMDLPRTVEGDPLAYIVRTVLIVGSGIGLILAYFSHEGVTITLLKARLRAKGATPQPRFDAERERHSSGSQHHPLFPLQKLDDRGD